uniref:Uncharacterized protein n=1 Tax=Anguilla anguilla TaxID=7936 RepID=A0A0E9TGP9_ANGAN
MTLSSLYKAVAGFEVWLYSLYGTFFSKDFPQEACIMRCLRTENCTVQHGHKWVRF